MASGPGQLCELVETAVASGLYTSLVALVGDAGTIQRVACAGSQRPRSRRPGKPAPVHRETLFDLASLTKSFTAGLALILDASGDLPLALPIGEAVDNAPAALADRTLGDLLRHRSGLVPWAPLYARCADRQETRALLLDSGQLGGELLGAETGTYSDLGFILWGLIAEEWLACPLAELLAERLLEPLGLAGAGSRPGEVAGVAACLIDGAKERDLATKLGLEIATPPAPSLGEPQDGNARFLGGLAGHAGLFASAEQLWRYAREWLTPGRLFDPARVARALGGSAPFLLGWGRPGAWASSTGFAGPTSFGALGFTGGSVWIEPELGRIALIAGHRASPLSDLAPFRRQFHELAWR